MQASREGRVAFADTDASTFIHFTSPLRWVEECEHALYRSIEGAPAPTAFPRKVVEVSYHRPFFAGEAFVVRLSVTRLGRTSIGYGWEIVAAPDQAVAITGSHTVVHLDESGAPAPLPRELRTALERDAELSL